MEDLKKRKALRLQGFDYNEIGAYFITICTQNRQQILADIVGDDVLGVPPCINLFPCGMVADKFINQLNDFYDDLSVESYVIMPNHIHIMLFVNPLENGTPRTSSPTRQTTTVSHFVSTFKRFCNKECGKNIWQRAFHDHVIRNREDYEKHLKYIHENPMNWQLDELYTEK